MFPIQMTITVNDAAQLAALVDIINGGKAPATTASRTVVAKAEQVKQPVEKAEVAAAEPDAVEALTEEMVATALCYTLDDAKRLTTAAVKAGKRTEIVALLAKFNVQQAVKLSPEQIAPFCAEAEALSS